MRHRKLVLEMLGLCAAAILSTMTLFAVSAQGDFPNWLESGAAINQTKAVQGEKDSASWLLDWTLFGASVQMHCTDLVVKDGLLFPDGTGLAELEFKNNCLFLANGAALPECDPKEPIITKVRVLQFKHNGETYLLFSPHDGALTFVTIKLDKNGSGCGVGESIAITGHIIVKDPTNQPLVDLVKHLLEPVVGTSLDLAGPPERKNSLKFGANPMTLLGSQWLKLATGSAWAGHAPPTATWLEINSQTIGSTLEVKGEKDSTSWLLDSTALGGAVQIHCKELVVKDGLLFATGTALAELEFKSDCLFLFNGVALTECDPKEPIVSHVKVEQFLHEKEGYFLFSPASGTLNFVTLKLDKTGAGCAIGENIGITGHVIAKDFSTEPSVNLIKHLLEPVAGTALDLAGPPIRKNSLKFGANSATLLGSQWLKLATERAWAGHTQPTTTWLEANPRTIGSTLELKGEKDSTSWLLDSTALGGVVQIHCNELVIKDGLLFPDGTGLAELEFKNDCLLLFNGVATAECDPKEPIVSHVKVEQFLHEKEGYFLFSPASGTLNFLTLKLDRNGPGCLLGETYAVTGHVIAKDASKEPLVDKAQHLIEPVSGKALDLAGPPVRNNSLKFGANTATLLGSEWLKLATGNPWAGHA